MHSFQTLIAEGETPAPGFDWSMLLLLGALGLMMIFMFRSNKKRKNQAQKMQDQVQIGADVMTSFGLFGTVLDIDEENNIVSLETTPGQVLRVHRQVVTTVVDPESAEDSVTEDSVEIPEDARELTEDTDGTDSTDKA